MKKNTLIALGLAALNPAGAAAQSAVDAYNITPTQLRGTARFIAMGGAFTSLGGDLSSMTQNPAGLGLYRKSDIGLTFDLSFRKHTSTTDQGKYSENKTLMKFDNIGYVGVADLNGAMKSFSWGVSYNRINVFDRQFSGYNMPTQTSLSNYIASYTNGVNSDNLLFDNQNNYNPYLDSDEDWLSILAYNSMLISNTTDNSSYAGLFQNGTNGDALYDIREHGFTDEYNIDFAGNVNDVVFWGLGVGIVDTEYHREAFYSESMEGALVYDNGTNRLATGNAGYNLSNFKYTRGTGANLKFGLIVRPVEMLRLGVAVHTPTWLSLTHTGYATVDYNYTPDAGSGNRGTISGSEYTDDYDFDSRLTSPWRFMVGASAVIGSQAIVSLDYERVAYGNMSMKSPNYSNFGGNFVENTLGNEDIKNYFKAANIVRIGAEYRMTPSLSLRAGYNYQTTNVKSDAADNRMEIFTVGTDPSYSFDKATQNFSVGIGYRYRGWYIDATYQHTRRESTFHAYTPFEGLSTPQADRVDTHNNVVISTGFRF